MRRPTLIEYALTDAIMATPRDRRADPAYLLDLYYAWLAQGYRMGDLP